MALRHAGAPDASGDLHGAPPDGIESIT